MKFRLGLIPLVALVVTDHACALNIAQTNAALQVYVSGSSTSKVLIEALLGRNCIRGTLTTYSSKADFAATNVTEATFTTAGALDRTDGASFNTYSCTLTGTAGSPTAGNDFGAQFNGQNVAFNKRDRGGSSYGVFPVAYNTAIKFMKISAASCAEDLATGSTTCTQVHSKQPHGGLSDFEPAIYNGGYNRHDDFVRKPAVALYDFGSVTPLYQIGYALTVSQKLYDDLQAEQVALGYIAAGAQPIAPVGVVAMMARQGFDSSIAWKAMLPLHDGVAREGINGGVAFPNTNSSKVKICSESKGESSKIAFNRFFLEYPLNGSAIPAGRDASVPGVYEVQETIGGSNQSVCLVSSSYAFGVQAPGEPQSLGWKYVRISAASRDRNTIKAGLYPFVFTSTLQTNPADKVNGISSTNAVALLNGLALEIRKPWNLDGLGTTLSNTVTAVGDSERCFNIASGNLYPFVWGDGDANNRIEKYCPRTIRADSIELPVLIK